MFVLVVVCGVAFALLFGRMVGLPLGTARVLVSVVVFAVVSIFCLGLVLSIVLELLFGPGLVMVQGGCHGGQEDVVMW